MISAGDCTNINRMGAGMPPFLWNTDMTKIDVNSRGSADMTEIDVNSKVWTPFDSDSLAYADRLAIIHQWEITTN